MLGTGSPPTDVDIRNLLKMISVNFSPRNCRKHNNVVGSIQQTSKIVLLASFNSSNVKTTAKTGS